jgi:cleavage and polyadenylation specificity factor subunit 3
MKREGPGESSAEDVLEVVPLGGGGEVGRSCLLLRFKGKTVMLDCGMHPAFPGQAGLP